MMLQADSFDDQPVVHDAAITDPIHDSSSGATKLYDHGIVYRSMFLVTFAMMASLAVCLVFAANLLDYVKDYWPNQHLSDSEQAFFEHGISMAPIFTFIFRTGHNIFFVRFRPRTRYIFALLSMIIMLSIILVAFFWLQTRNLWWIYIAYAFAGVTFGLNEPNLFRSTAYLGKSTNIWIFYGLGAGYNLATILGLYLLSMGLHLSFIYISAIVLCILAIAVYQFVLSTHDAWLHNENRLSLTPNINSSFHARASMDSHESLSWKDVKLQVQEWRNWFTVLWPFAIVVLLNYFMLNAFGNIPYYVMPTGKVPLIGRVWMDRDVLFSINGILWVLASVFAYAMVHYCGCIRDFILKYPACILLLHICGALLSCCMLFIQPLVNVVGTAIISFAFALIYKSAVTFIELKIDHSYKLIALSLCFMFGDIGATIGANTWPFIVSSVCRKTTESYYCDNN